MNRYNYQFAAICPSDGETIIYHLTIKTSDLIKAEDIVAACKVGTVYHETIADELAAKFGGRQKLRATHQGVHITTTRKEPA